MLIQYKTGPCKAVVAQYDDYFRICTNIGKNAVEYKRKELGWKRLKNSSTEMTSEGITDNSAPSRFPTTQAGYLPKDSGTC